jgi:ribosomal protein S6
LNLRYKQLLRYLRFCATLLSMESEQKLYEIVFLVSPDQSLEEANQIHQNTKNAVQELGGLIDDEGGVMRRRLSYIINKAEEAYIEFFKFLLSPQKIVALNEKMNTPNILRYLIVETKRIPQRAPKRYKPTPHSDETKEYKDIKEVEKPASSPEQIAEIDKKLEEILGT